MKKKPPKKAARPRTGRTSVWLVPYQGQNIKEFYLEALAIAKSSNRVFMTMVNERAVEVAPHDSVEDLIYAYEND